LSLIFAFFSFSDNGKWIEMAAGSTNFAVLLLSMSGIVSLLHHAILICFFVIYHEDHYLDVPMDGIWVLILALTAKECSKADPDSKRRIFFFEVPTRQYPLTLLALFTLFGGINLSFFISVGVGYLDGYEKLGFTRISYTRRKGLENGALRKFTMKDGFVVGPSGDVWNEIVPFGTARNANEGDKSSNAGSQQEGGWTPTVFRRPADKSGPSGTDSVIPVFEQTGGERLGGSSRSRPNASPLSMLSRSGQESSTSNQHGSSKRVDRAAMLAAAERRAKEKIVVPSSSLQIHHDIEEGTK